MTTVRSENLASLGSSTETTPSTQTVLGTCKRMFSLTFGSVKEFEPVFICQPAELDHRTTVEEVLTRKLEDLLSERQALWDMVDGLKVMVRNQASQIANHEAATAKLVNDEASKCHRLQLEKDTELEEVARRWRAVSRELELRIENYEHQAAEQQKRIEQLIALQEQLEHKLEGRMRNRESNEMSCTVEANESHEQDCRPCFTVVSAGAEQVAQQQNHPTTPRSNEDKPRPCGPRTTPRRRWDMNRVAVELPIFVSNDTDDEQEDTEEDEEGLQSSFSEQSLSSCSSVSAVSSSESSAASSPVSSPRHVSPSPSIPAATEQRRFPCFLASPKPIRIRVQAVATRPTLITRKADAALAALPSRPAILPSALAPALKVKASQQSKPRSVGVFHQSASPRRWK